jgi:hypothetical protein
MRWRTDEWCVERYEAYEAALEAGSLELLAKLMASA